MKVIYFMNLSFTVWLVLGLITTVRITGQGTRKITNEAHRK